MSGVYIKGLEMPKDGEHPYWVTIHSDGIVEYNENKGQGWQTSEAVPVPDHGRLVDADLLAQSKECKRKGCVYQEEIYRAPTIIPADKEAEQAERYLSESSVLQAVGDVHPLDYNAQGIVERIKAIPAADVKPVIHAHFYVDEGCAYCSNCRNNFKKAILKAVKFCPMCGAQIDGYGGHPDAGPPTPYDLLFEEGGPDA